MPEPTSTALAVTTAAASSLAVVATAMGVPASVVLTAILGATIAVSMSGKIDWSVGSLTAALMTWGAALGLGISGGRFAGHLLIGFLNGILPPSQRLPQDFADPLFTLLIAMVGQSQLLPIGLSLLRNKAGGPQS